MKRCFLCLLCVLMVLSTLAGCRKESDTYSSWYSYIEVEDIADDETSSDATSSNDKIKYDSTIPTPKSMTLYKGGMHASVTSKNLRLKAAKEIEKLFYDYNSNNLPTVDMDITRQFIWELKQNETVIELRFELDYQEKLNLLGKINLEKTYAVLMPITGKYAYYLFSGYGIDEYTNKPYKLKGSGLEKIFEGVTLDTKVRTWETTVEAPATITFYKDGATAVSTDKEFNLKVAQHIENWFKYKSTGIGLSLAATSDTLRPIRQNELAVELQFDNDIVFFGQTKFSNSRTIFIPVTGEHANIIFSNSIRYPDSWSGPIYGGTGLNQFFDYVQFTPLTEEEKRWRSTVRVASYIAAVENGEIIGESGITFMSDYSISYVLMQNVENFFYRKEEIKRLDSPLSDSAFEDLKSKGKYLLIGIIPDTTFYGQQILTKNTNFILIPLEGDYAYYIFELDQNKNQCANPIITEGGNLEKDFETVKSMGLHINRNVD